MQTLLDCAGRILNLNRPCVMGILNVTPDSFSDGGRYSRLEHALAHARSMIQAGAAIIDVGGESTRPDAAKISVDEEVSRVIPVVEALRRETDVVISVDTSAPEVMRAAVAAGAGIINDVRALTRPDALEAAVECQVPVIVMHSLSAQPEPGFVPEYDDVVASVCDYLQERIGICEKAGIPRERIIVDPGFGGGMFGKTPACDLQMLGRFREFRKLELPVLAGVSRKSFIGAVLNNSVDQRLAGSLAAAILLVQAGVQILRVHDVQETADALALLQAVTSSPG